MTAFISPIQLSIPVWFLVLAFLTMANAKTYGVNPCDHCTVSEPFYDKNCLADWISLLHCMLTQDDRLYFPNSIVHTAVVVLAISTITKSETYGVNPCGHCCDDKMDGLVSATYLLSF